MKNCTEDEIEEIRQAGREGGRQQWLGMNAEEREQCVDAGRNWWATLNDVEKHGLVEARKEAWRQLSPNVQENILDNLGFHAEVARTIRRIEAEERYEEDGEAEIVPDVSIWNCDGCDLECSKNVRQLSFVGVSNVKMLRWLLSHKLMRPLCQMSGCGGSSCFPVSLGVKSCGLKCPACSRISVGGKRGISPNQSCRMSSLCCFYFVSRQGNHLRI